MQATPATWRLLVGAGWRGGPAFRALSGGEALSPDLAGALLERAGEVWNMYGPTETTVWSTCARVLPGAPVTIGRPIANTTVHVLDEAGREAPPGVVGEICIGGDGVTLGYLDRPELTAERFLADPFRLAPGARLYRTGDLGRLRADGTLECLGRTDHQVKVRGHRIELGEIEVALAAHAGVREAVVVAREDRPGDVRLVAYVVPSGAAAPGDDALREHLSRALPDYMLPSRYVALPSLPLLPNGKIDRKALPAPAAIGGDPAASGPRGDAGGARPLTPTETRVARAFEEALALPSVGPDDGFFVLGGHSLLAAQMVARLSRELDLTVPMRAAFENPTVAKLAAWIDAQRAVAAPDRPRVPRREGSGPAPLSLMQQRLWYLEQLQLGRTVFHVPSAHRLVGALDEGAFARAFAEMLRRQPALRTHIGVENGEPVQVVTDALEVSLFPAHDLGALPEADCERELARLLEEATAERFDLSRGPLFRARMFKLGPEDHVLFFMAHHVVFDGWSFDLLYEELSELYAAYREGRAPSRPEPSVTYADFAAWHRDWLAGAELDRQVAYWHRKLAGAPDALDLPVDLPRPAVQTGEGATEWLAVPPAEAASLRELGVREGATFFMALLAAWAIVLHRAAGQREIVVGTPVRGRSLPELEDVMGFFVNALPLRLRVDPDASFLENLRAIRAEVVEAFGHQDVPFEHLVRVLDVSRDESRFPIYQTFFSYQDARNRPPAWGNLAHENVPIFQPSSAQDVALWFLDGASGVVGGLNYNTDIFLPETARRLKDRYLALVEAIARDPSRPVRELVRISDEERAQLAAWNASGARDAADATRSNDDAAGTPARAPSGATLTAYLAPSFAEHASRVAVRCGGESLTYAELSALADRVARAIHARGAGRGHVVALHLRRSPLMLAALLGALRAGATYLPLDASFPEDRLRFMLADSGARLVLTDEDADLGEGAPPALRIDRELPAAPAGALASPDIDREDPAYLIYTSGSTGQPKGVLVPHRAVVNFLASMAKEPGLGAADRLVAVTTLSFDIAVLELLVPLSVGAEIVLATREEAMDGHALRRLLEEHEATCMQATPATWRMLLEAGWRGGAAFKALSGGEALPPELAEALLERTGALFNMYGPTETTVWSTLARIEPGAGAITIGRPIQATRVWILDEAGELAPVGVAGEIAIGGEGVALGYHARPELTRERFVPDPFAKASSPGAGTGAARMYRTGDLGRWRSDGQLVHLGRTDFQVKIRGYRIELGEIEVALASHPGVARAVVAAGPGPGGERRLVAYVVPRQTQAPAAAALREHLRVSLPDYMIPAVYVTIDRVPLTPNGKVDRRALPEPALERDAAADAHATAGLAEPRTRNEKLVADVWRELLGVSRIAPLDNFLDLGGHSLLIMRAVSMLEARTGKRLSPRAFIFQTLQQIAHELDDLERAAEGGATAGAAKPDARAKRPAAGLVRRLFSAITRTDKQDS